MSPSKILYCQGNVPSDMDVVTKVLWAHVWNIYYDKGCFVYTYVKLCISLLNAISGKYFTQPYNVMAPLIFSNISIC